MQRSRHQFLSGAVPALNEHSGIGRSHLVNHFLDFLDFRRFAYHFLTIDLLFQKFSLFHQVALVRGVLDGNEYPVQVQWFGQEIESPQFYALDRRVDVPVP